MICPQCQAEYRQGFTRCADCDVDLVPDPNQFSATGGQNVPGPGDPNEDPFCSFWKGEDPRIHAELCEVLDEAGVPHKTVFRRDHLFNLRNYPVYEVGVPFSLFDKAEAAIKEAFGTEDEEDRETLNTPRLLEEKSQFLPKLPVSMTPAQEENIPGPPRARGEADWDAAEATARVWSTETSESGDFLVAALHENNIRCRLDCYGQRAALFVLPEDASRAREIVKEVGEAKPPM